MRQRKHNRSNRLSIVLSWRGMIKHIPTLGRLNSTPIGYFVNYLFINLIWSFVLLFFVKEPSFVASFEVDDYVLFFLKEKSVEQVAENQDVVYSRVIRVCKVRKNTNKLKNIYIRFYFLTLKKNPVFRAIIRA